MSLNNIQQVQGLLEDQNAVSGYLNLLAPGVHSQTTPIPWVRRFCILSSGHLFLFASSSPPEFELDRFPLGPTCSVISIVNSLSASTPLAFEVCEGSDKRGRSWILSTQNKSSKNTWIDMINSEITFINEQYQLQQRSSEHEVISAQEKVRRLQMQLEQARMQLNQNNVDDVDFQNRFSQATTLTNGSYQDTGPFRRDSTARTMSTHSGGSARQSVASASRSDVGVKGGGVFGGVDSDEDDGSGSKKGFFGLAERKKSVGSGSTEIPVSPKKAKSAKVQMSQAFIQF